MAYSTVTGLFIYDVVTNTPRQLTDIGSPPGLVARFRTSAQISLVQQRSAPDEAHTFGQDSMFEYDTTENRSTEILQLPDRVLAHDWSSDGTALAYLLRSQSADLVGPHLLCAFDTQTGKTSLVRHINNPFGTGVGQRDETAVTWSPDDGAILVTDTAARPGLFVVTLDGQDVVPPRPATFGRWESEDRLIFQQDPQNAAEPWEWLFLATQTGATRGFGFPDTAYRPAVSPSGDLIAYDDGEAQPSVYLFDTAERAVRLLATGYVAPIWIGPGKLAMTAAGPCTTGDFCEIPWELHGTTSGVDVTGSHRAVLALPSTLSEVARYGTVDVQLP